MTDTWARWLYLLQLTDSGLPIGTTAHSFGLETLTQDGGLTVPTLPDFFADYLTEIGTLEAVYTLTAHRIAGQVGTANATIALTDWRDLNDRLSALQIARESRAASTTLGRRFLTLVASLITTDSADFLHQALEIATPTGIHHCTAFGFVGGILAVEPELTALAYLQQSLTGLISACQRLMPLGQNAASRIGWDLKPRMIEVVANAMSLTPETVFTFAPGLDMASLRHPTLDTRLFIS